MNLGQYFTTANRGDRVSQKAKPFRSHNRTRNQLEVAWRKAREAA